jgi:hypothetical protein
MSCIMTFQVVDMRWGVRDEATDDHMTTELCMREIANCQRLSMGPNFVVSSLTVLTITNWYCCNGVRLCICGL